MRVVSRLSIAAAVLVSVHSLAGCTESDSSPTGELSVNLVGQAPSGAIYRLRDATVVVDGPTTHRVFNTEDDLVRTSLEANVVTGDYSAVLEPGWRLERVEGASTTTVDATLTSANPSLFTVFDDQRTFVPLKFRIAGEEVNLAQGYGIIIEIEEPRCGDGALDPGELCDDGNTNHFDACTRICTFAPAEEIEPNEDGTPSTGGDPLRGNDFAASNADLYGAIPLNGDAITRVAASASLSPAGDEDVYPIVNVSASDRFVIIDTGAPDGSLCGPETDTALVLRDANGTVLAVNNDRSSGDRCSQMTVILGPNDVVYVQVVANGDAAVMPYKLFVFSS